MVIIMKKQKNNFEFTELKLEDVESFYQKVMHSQIMTFEVNHEVELLESLLCTLLERYEKNPPDGFRRF